MVALPLLSSEGRAKSVSLESIDEVLRQLGPGPSRQATMDAIRQAVIRDIDVKFTERSEDMWKRGKLMMQQMQQRQLDMTAKFAEEVARVHDQQRALEADNDRLRHALMELSERFANINASPVPDIMPAPSILPPGLEANDLTPNNCVNRLPEIPPFPFPRVPPPATAPVAPSQLAPLSLADALSTSAARTPLSLEDSLAPPAVSPHADGGVPPFFMSPEVARTDNHAGNWSPSDQQRVAEEWDEQQLLRLAMLRGGCPTPTTPPPMQDYSPGNSCWLGSALRADASVFVPMGSPTCA